MTPEPLTKRYQNQIILAFVLWFTALAYSNSVRNGFIDFDDPENIVDNVSIRVINWDNLVHWFSTPLQFMYTPLVSLSYAIDYRFGQLDPSAYHLTNLLLHLGNVALVYFVFQALTKRPFVAHFVAIFFAIHPVNVDGISWIATRSQLLATFFFLSALLLYSRYAETQEWPYLALSSALFVLAVLSKSTTVVFPLTLFLWDHFTSRKIEWRLLLEKIPFFAISLVTGLVALHFRIDTNVLYHYNFFDRFILICSALVAYLEKLVFPYHLAFAYRYPAKTDGFLPWWMYLSPFILAAVAFVLYKIRVPKKVLIFGLSFFLVNILLSQTVLLIDNFESNRYAYLPYVGLFFILGDITERLLGWIHGWQSGVRIAWGSILVVAIVLFSFTTYQRNALWKDTIKILSNSIENEPGVPFTYNNRGISEYKAGNYSAALADFQKTLSLDPNFTLSYYYRGLIKYANHDVKGAIADYDEAISRSEGFVAAYNDRGKALMDLKDYNQALTNFSKAIDLDSYYVDAYFNRGISYFNLGNYQNAIQDYTRALEFDPQFADAYNNRGSAEFELGDAQAALNDFNKAIELSPQYLDAFDNRGIARSRLNDTAGACADWNAALSMGSKTAAQHIKESCPTP